MNKCEYNINKKTIPIQECGEEAKWEVGFCRGSWNEEGSGDNEFINIFCHKHFELMESMGNSVEYRKIGEKEWKKF